MRSNYVIFGLLILVTIFISGCVQEVICNPPYIKVGTTCCLDQNNNSICDTDEQQISQPQETATYCGDGICQPNENCSSCPQDCGICEKETIGSTKKYGSNQIIECEENSNDRDACYRYYAVKEKNYQYCEQIYDLTKKDDCFYTVGTMTKNTYICDLISTTSDCEAHVQGPSGSLDCKDACYHDIAVSTLNPSICENIKTQNGRDACYWRVAINAEKPNICSKIVTSAGIISNDFCYYSIAVQTSDINVCNPIKDPCLHDECMMVIIRDLELKDISLCDQMTCTDPNWKSECQYEIQTGNYVK